MSDNDNVNVQSEYNDSAGIISSGDTGAYPVVTAVSELARDKRTILQGNGSDTVTIRKKIN